MWDQNKRPTYIIPTTSIPAYPAVAPIQEPEGWWKRNYKNKPQSNSVGSASLIFISGGMSMAWNLGFPMNSVGTHILLSWFIGCIIGAVIGGASFNYISKKIITCFAAMLVMISGIIMISDSNSYDAITAARYINGIAVGLVFPLTFVLVGEEVVKSMRGMNAVAIDTMSFSLGIFLQTMYSNIWNHDIGSSMNITQLSGIFNIMWGGIAFIIAFMLLIESPLFYLVRNQEEKAIDVLRRLQRPFTITYETYEQLDEHKRYLAESKEQSFLQSAVKGLPALIILCFYRSLAALSFSFLANFAFTYATVQTSSLDSWLNYVYGLVRWIGAMFVAFTVDYKGRKSSMVYGCFICCILAFTVGGIFDDKSNFFNTNFMNAVKYILLCYQLFASISVASSSAYLSEAFPLAVKPYYIAAVFIVEMLVHVIIISSRATFFFLNVFKVSDYFYSLGALSLVFFFIALFVMPETKWNTLRECLTKFQKLINYKP